MGGKVAYGLVGGREWFKVDYPNSKLFCPRTGCTANGKIKSLHLEYRQVLYGTRCYMVVGVIWQ